jgi:UTP--glucose-1-phosphate uridylyltransferase
LAVRKAVIPAAGFGTRFLPTSKAQPKEMLNVVDKPCIQYIVEEAVRSGMTDILIVTSRGKSSIEDHFDYAPDLEEHLEKGGKTKELEEVRRIAELADVHFVRQKEQKGFGHAVLMAKDHIGNEPFAVLVGDEIVPDPDDPAADLLPRMSAIFDDKKKSVLSVVDVPKDEVSSYGIIDAQEIGDGLYRVTDMIEKPEPDQAPSTLGSRGRYIFTPDLFDALARTEPGHGGEIQLTDAIKQVAKADEVYASTYDGPIFDVGRPASYLEATIQLALRRPELAEGLESFITQTIKGDG